jgi:hypothetical protein
MRSALRMYFLLILRFISNPLECCHCYRGKHEDTIKSALDYGAKAKINAVAAAAGAITTPMTIAPAPAVP